MNSLREQIQELIKDTTEIELEQIILELHNENVNLLIKLVALENELYAKS